MYLRYGDPSWDSAESGDASASAGSSAQSGVLEADKDAAARHREGPNGFPINGNGNGNGHRRKAEPAPSNGEHLPTVELHGVQIHAITEAQTIAHILGALDARRGGVVVTP